MAMLLLTAGKLHRVGIRLIGKPHRFQQLHSPLPCFLFGCSHQLQREADVVQRRALIQQIKALENHGDFTPLKPQLLLLQTHQVAAVKQHPTLLRPFQQIDAAHQRGLTGTGQADDAEDIALLHLQAYILQSRHLCLPCAEGF